jgi:hypothetical protein
MRSPILFSFSVLLTMMVAGYIAYKFGLPLLENDSIRCGSPGSRSYAFGCQTKSNGFFTFLLLAVSAMIYVLWRNFRD